jgi:hypothetical protein
VFDKYLPNSKPEEVYTPPYLARPADLIENWAMFWCLDVCKWLFRRGLKFFRKIIFLFLTPCGND